MSCLKVLQTYISVHPKPKHELDTNAKFVFPGGNQTHDPGSVRDQNLSHYANRFTFIFVGLFMVSILYIRPLVQAYLTLWLLISVSLCNDISLDPLFELKYFPLGQKEHYICIHILANIKYAKSLISSLTCIFTHQRDGTNLIQMLYRDSVVKSGKIRKSFYTLANSNVEAVYHSRETTTKLDLPPYISGSWIHCRKELERTWKRLS